MEGFSAAVLTAIWLGILTSVSPCPLATNIAAIGYIGRRVEQPRLVLLSGILYTLGRLVSYVGLAALLVGSLFAIPELARWLQKYMNVALGPLLLLTGLFLIGLIPLRLPGFGVGERLQRRVDRMGLWGGGLLGLLFALSFCPVSAALYFGSLIPLALQYQSAIVLPTLYGLGTALPVVAFALLIAYGAKYIGSVFHRLDVISRWARRVTGVLFIVVGGYYSLMYIFGIW